MPERAGSKMATSARRAAASANDAKVRANVGPRGLPTRPASPIAKGNTMAKAQTEDAPQTENLNSDGFPIEARGSETATNGGKRGRKPGTVNRPPVLTTGSARSVSAADLGLDLKAAQAMTTKQTGGGRTAGERSEIQQQFDADVLNEFVAWYDRNDEAIKAGNWPADAPELRLPQFTVVDGVEFTERTVEHTPEVAAKIGRTSTVITESVQLTEAGRYLTNARDHIRKDYPQLVLHVYSPRQHVDGRWLIPWAVYAKQDQNAPDAD